MRRASVSRIGVSLTRFQQGGSPLPALALKVAQTQTTIRQILANALGCAASWRHPIHSRDNMTDGSVPELSPPTNEVYGIFAGPVDQGAVARIANAAAI